MTRFARGNHHVHRAAHAVRKAFEAHSDICEWPKGCDRSARWYHTTISGRWSLCDGHTPVEWRTDPITQNNERAVNTESLFTDGGAA